MSYLDQAAGLAVSVWHRRPDISSQQPRMVGNPPHHVDGNVLRGRPRRLDK